MRCTTVEGPTPILFSLIQAILQFRIKRSRSVISRKQLGMWVASGTSMAAPTLDTFTIRQRVLDPATEMKATSSISARVDFLRSSIKDTIGQQNETPTRVPLRQITSQE